MSYTIYMSWMLSRGFLKKDFDDDKQMVFVNHPTYLSLLHPSVFQSIYPGNCLDIHLTHWAWDKIDAI